MSCCGKMRLAASAPGNLASTARVPPPVRAPRQSRYFFEYVGQTGLTVIGPASGRRYRFDRPGARLEVDVKDRRWLAGVPHLRQISPGPN
jgi:hypothetical protein